MPIEIQSTPITVVLTDSDSLAGRTDQIVVPPESVEAVIVEHFGAGNPTKIEIRLPIRALEDLVIAGKIARIKRGES